MNEHLILFFFNLHFKPLEQIYVQSSAWVLALGAEATEIRNCLKWLHVLALWLWEICEVVDSQPFDIC